MLVLKLFHDKELIGLITGVVQEGLNMNGEIKLTPAADKFKEIFAFFADEKRSDEEEPPFPDDLLYNWSIELESGAFEEISIPTIYPDGVILWR